MSILKTGDIFQVKNKIGKKIFLPFCFDSDEDNETSVEHAWFRKRKIRKLQPGMEVRKGDVIGVITPMRNDVFVYTDRQGFDLAGKLRVEIIKAMGIKEFKVETVWDYKEIELV